MRTNKIVYFGLVAGLFWVSCKFNGQKFDPDGVCSEFYELNKDADFNGLFNVHVLGIREYSEFNDSTLKYNRIPVVIGINDSISKSHIKLPSFRRDADMDEKERFFARCDSSCISYLKNKYNTHSNDSIFGFYVKEIESIYSNYYQIKVPRMLPYTNIELRGGGNYIEFVLYRNEEEKINYRCYYLKDTIFSNDRQKDYFNRISKLDRNWRYDLN